MTDMVDNVIECSDNTGWLVVVLKVYIAFQPTTEEKRFCHSLLRTEQNR